MNETVIAILFIFITYYLSGTYAPCVKYERFRFTGKPARAHANFEFYLNIKSKI